MSQRRVASVLVCAAALLSATTAGAAVHQVYLTQTESGGTVTCSVAPDELRIAEGDEVEFIVTSLATANDVQLKKKAHGGGGLQFRKGTDPPKDEFASAPGTPATTPPAKKGPGPDGDYWRYEAMFRKTGEGQPVVCRVDPVICIPGGGLSECDVWLA